MVLFLKATRYCGKKSLTSFSLQDVKIKAKLLLSVPIPSDELQAGTFNTLLDAIRIKQKRKPRVNLTLNKECISFHRKDARSTEGDVINVPYNKIAGVKTFPKKDNVVSITYVSPDSHLICCCLKLMSLENQRQRCRRKCKGVELQAYINQSQYSACRKEGNSSTLVEAPKQSDEVSHNSSEHSLKCQLDRGQINDTQIIHKPAFSIHSGVSHLNLINSGVHTSEPSAFQLYDDVSRYARTMFKNRDTSQLIPLFNSCNDFSDEDREVAKIMFQC